MLCRAILLTALLLLPNFFVCEGTASQSQDPSSVEAEEYAAYSAFINQEYIPYYSTPKYTLQGGLVEDRALDEKGTVVILASTQQEFANVVGVNRYMLQAFLRGETNEDAEETFEDLISKSRRRVPLSNRFDLSMRYQLASNKEWHRDKFLEKFPHSKGLLSFSRVGFNPSRTKAVFLLAQLDLNNKKNQQPSESTYLVLLNKESEQWKLNKMWGPEKKSFVINLRRCDKASRHISLPLGSESFSINGRDGDRCVIEHMSEIEGGYTRTRCRVPVRSGKLTIFESGFDNHVFVFSMDLSRYCDKPVHGNIFFDRIKPPRSQPL
jgi:hypothetical protein